MIYKTIARANHYIANTVYEKDVVVRQGIDPRKVSVIGPGIDPNQFVMANGTESRARYGFGTAPVIGFIGQQASHKGLDTLLEAMPHVWDAQPTTRLLIAGARTGFSTRVDALIASLGHRRTLVVVVPNFSEDEKPHLFAACDVIAYPSGFESFGIVFLEAWASRKPVVGCDSGAVSSVVDHGRDGLLVPYHNARALSEALLRLISNPSLRWELGTRGYEKVHRQHTWPSVVARFRDVYERVCLESAPSL